MMKMATQKIESMMMKNNFTTSCILAVLISAFLSACSGGIQGTGDGNPIDIVLPNGSDNEGIGNSVNGAPADTSGDGSQAPTQETDNQVQLPDLSMIVPEALIAAQSRSDQSSSSVAFTQQITIAVQEINQIAAALLDYESYATNTDLVANHDNAFTFASSETNNSIYWSDKGLSLFSTNDNRHLHLYENGRLWTIRRFDRQQNILIQAHIHQSPTEGAEVTIQAALNNNGTESYLRAVTNTNGATVLFTQHPTDNSATKQREILDVSGVATDIQTCAAGDLCQSDNNWSVVADAGNGAANTRFTNATSDIDSTLRAITAQSYELPPAVNAAVLTSGNTGQHQASKIECSLVRADNSIKAFCLLPQPLTTSGDRFQELLSGGEVFYQLLQ